MTNNEKQPIVSIDYEAELEQLKRIYDDNRKVEQSVIDFNNQNSAVDTVAIFTCVMDNTGGDYAK